MSGGQQALLGGGSGGETATITLVDDTYINEREGLTAQSWFDLNADGTAEGRGTFPYTYRDGDIAANYEVLVTETVGAMTSGPVGAWTNLGTDREWVVTRTGATGPGSTSCTATFQIRKVGTTTVLDSATITLTATVT